MVIPSPVYTSIPASSGSVGESPFSRDHYDFLELSILHNNPPSNTDFEIPLLGRQTQMLARRLQETLQLCACT